MPSLTEESLVNRRQELADRIAIAEAEVTPGLAMIPKENGLDQWSAEEPAQAYPNVSFEAVLDGAPVTKFETTNQLVVKGRGQELRRAFRVTQQAAVVRTAGIKNQVNKQRADGSLLFARMQESLLCCDQDSQELALAESKPNKTRGIFKWLSTTAQGHYPVPEAIRPGAGQVYTGAFANIDQKTFTDMFIAAWKKRNGAKITLDGLIGADLQDVIDDFTIYDKVPSGKTLLRTINQGDSKTYSREVNVIKSSFGTVRCHVSPWLLRNPANGEATDYSHKSGVFLDMAMWSMRWIKHPMFHKLPNDGSGEAEYINGMFMVLCRNPVGQLAIRPTS